MDQWIRENAGWLVPLATLVLTWFLNRFATTRAEQAKVAAEVASSQATAAKVQAEAAKVQVEVSGAATEARFEVQKREWAFLNERLERVINDYSRLENKYNTLQAVADAERENGRKRIDALEALVDKQEQSISKLIIRCDALENHVADFYASLKFEPMPIQERIRGRMRTQRPDPSGINGDQLKAAQAVPDPDEAGH